MQEVKKAFAFASELAEAVGLSWPQENIRALFARSVSVTELCSLAATTILSPLIETTSVIFLEATSTHVGNFAGVYAYRSCIVADC